MIKTREIFEILSHGGFICQDSARAENRRLFDYIEEHFEEYKAYFQEIGFVLEQGNGYFHFTREESRAELTRRLTTLGVWIDRLDFLKTFYGGFTAGCRFTPSAIMEATAADVELKEKAQQVQLLGDSKAVAVRSCPGFPVNVIGPLSVRLGERKLLLCPCPGSFLYISDFLNFRIPSNAIVVGVENMENFRLRQPRALQRPVRPLWPYAPPGPPRGTPCATDPPPPEGV